MRAAAACYGETPIPGWGTASRVRVRPAPSTPLAQGPRTQRQACPDRVEMRELTCQLKAGSPALRPTLLPEAPHTSLQ